MKKQIIITMVCCALLFTACGKKADVSSSNVAKEQSSSQSIGSQQSSNSSELTKEQSTTGKYNIKHEEDIDNYSYWVGNDEKKGAFYMQEVLVVGEFTKKECLDYAREVENEKQSIETRVKFYTTYDEEQIIQPKANQFADIILRKGDIISLDSTTGVTSVISEEEFLKQ